MRAALNDIRMLSDEQLAALLRCASRDLDREQVDRALDLLRLLALLSPQSPTVWKEHARAYRKLGEPEAAEGYEEVARCLSA